MTKVLKCVYTSPAFKLEANDGHYGDHVELHKKMNFSIKDFLSKCDQIHRKLRIWSHLVKKS